MNGNDIGFSSRNTRNIWKPEKAVMEGGTNETRGIYDAVENLLLKLNVFGEEKWNKLVKRPVSIYFI